MAHTLFETWIKNVDDHEFAIYNQPVCVAYLEVDGVPRVITAAIPYEADKDLGKFVSDFISDYVDMRERF